jgi:hypothetical protein
MSLKFLAVSISAVGLLAAVNSARATPLASLGTVATEKIVAPAHYSKYRHKHEGPRIVYMTDRSGEKMLTGRSASKKKKHKKETEESNEKK